MASDNSEHYVRVRRALALSLVIGVICKLFRLFSVIVVLLQLLPPRRRVLSEVARWAQFGFIDER